MTLNDLALIGNGTVGALIDGDARISWCCLPRFDGDPTFCSLLRNECAGATDFGYFDIEVEGAARVEQEYMLNTAILVTRVFDDTTGCVEIIDFAPRYRQFGRIFAPMMLVRQLRRVSGRPRVRIRLRPAQDYGATPMPLERGSNHISYRGSDLGLRVTSNAGTSAIIEENPFFLDAPVTILLGPDETVNEGVVELGRHMLEETAEYWRTWVRALAIPFEWQDAVIRAAIALKLNVFEDTGAIIAAMTTSIPEAPGTSRNWDYRYCWIRDAYFVVNALNHLGATRIMERYVGFTLNVVAGAEDHRLKPLYTISGRPVPDETVAAHLDGYRGMGPVRIGNQAYHQVQHDVYGAAILAAPHIFFDQRLVTRGDADLFNRLETLGESAAALFDQPDAGIWELRGMQRVHTFSSVMCWAGCDRLSRIARHIGLEKRARDWRATADEMREVILERSYNRDLGSFVASMDGSTLDASLLRLNDVGFIAADDPRFIGTVEAIEKDLRHGDFIHRYSEEDDFGYPENSFIVCTFWYINALAAIGRVDEARALFDNILACRNKHGLFSEDIDTESRELWGNFVQTYSMVGLIDSAARLSMRWEDVY
jgi:GH15 family glucan-1,4-alpha-glucosidase